VLRLLLVRRRLHCSGQMALSRRMALPGLLQQDHRLQVLQVLRVSQLPPRCHAR
jgi:hypothetical protein